MLIFSNFNIDTITSKRVASLVACFLKARDAASSSGPMAGEAGRQVLRRTHWEHAYVMSFCLTALSSVARPVTSPTKRKKLFLKCSPKLRFWRRIVWATSPTQWSRSLKVAAPCATGWTTFSAWRHERSP